MNATMGCLSIYIPRLVLSSHHIFLLQQRYEQPLRASLHFRFLTDLVSRRSTVQHMSGFLTLFLL